ncbi:growth hormone receptor precursor, partial [Silurus asotus]
PHLTGCRSRELVTFWCRWSSGSFSNLSEPGALALFYQMKTEWQECPEYTPSVQNECYFNRDFTRIWTIYCIQLRSTSHTHNITYDEQCFNVENIVYPDPPISLNWTLLNISRSRLHFDIMVRWAPPPSAEVHTGWMSLKYEVHYRVQNSSHWDKVGHIHQHLHPSIRLIGHQKISKYIKG